MVEHSPGPWLIGEINHKRQRISIDTKAKDYTLGYTSWTGLARVYGCEDNPTEGSEVMEANARLIAAAPELLDVAQSIIADDLIPYLPAEYVAKVRAVLAKATGATP